jgi:hypothetical protein
MMSNTALNGRYDEEGWPNIEVNVNPPTSKNPSPSKGLKKVTAPHNDTELDEILAKLLGDWGVAVVRDLPTNKYVVEAKTALTQYIHKQVTEARRKEIEWVIGVAFKDDSLQILLQDRLAHLRKGEL